MALRLPPAWAIVLAGLILNIMAIVMSSLVLDKIEAEKAEYNDRKYGNVYSIQLAWNTIETLERKREAILIHLDKPETVQPTSVLDEALRGQLKRWVTSEVPSISLGNLPKLMTLINSAQEAQRTRIDDYYLDNLTLVELIQRLDEKMAFYKNIALFLQVFGLALILARDLARRP
ncbi:DNA mismatch repair protein [Vibrio sp. 10N.261.46.E12]|uniref:DNA mismatch repair protein n=1 Tax=unclassified Vibrio TaxID=2614977 RepID=UPI00097771D7|nr:MULTISPECIES: DNA mismatch repair protein [unclassified Vibrio]OMO35944.1 DNA mismatch repair protein [Vibrio sp. 10N.261.45.E1]PMJ19886.1 DNA mismatch repair protein [Vibrio sp. 10N.286.45.B6]PML85279.1 DNA mismatch repair protein [Vibrio sp. 10N.261.49.E11]PMM72708.1 DNA mismatch repair protein [Vibrio sp. 10N.261.46.F12]PMM84177.1 DNA mismatch repair protein [Vibrio sp. 10N.261.46.E8]